MLLLFLNVSSYNHIYSFAKPPAITGTPVRPTGELRTAGMPADDDAALNDAAYSAPMTVADVDGLDDVFMKQSKGADVSDKEVGNRVNLNKRPGYLQASDKYKDQESKNEPEDDKQGSFKWN